MSTDLVDYLYFEAKEKSMEIEIEARKEFEIKRNQIIKEKKKIVDEQFESDDKYKSTEFKQYRNQENIEFN